jgi:hypothetical protein
VNTNEAAAIFGELVKLWPKSPRTEMLDANRIARLERLYVGNSDGYSGADRCMLAIAAYYDRLMSESKTPRSTIPFDAIMAELRKLDPQAAPQPTEIIDTDTGEVTTPLPVLIDWYERAAARGDEKAKQAKPGLQIGTPGYWRWYSETCRRRAQVCREKDRAGYTQTQETRQ